MTALGDIITEIRNGIDLEQSDWRSAPGMLPISRIETISEGVIDFSRVKYVTPTLRDRQKYQLQSGDILFSHINSPEHIGKTALFRSNKILLQGINLLLLRVDKAACHPEYLNFYLKSFAVRARFRARCKKAVNQASLNQDDILSLDVPVPGLPEQKRIAAILEKAAGLHRTRRYARQLSDIFVQSVFLEMFGDPLQNSRNWDMTALGEKLNFLTSGSRGWAKYYRESGDLFLRIQNVGKNRLLLDDLTFVDPPKNAEGSRTVVQAGDVLLSITADLGRAAVVPKDLPKSYINQHLALLRLRDIDPVFAAALLSSREANRQWDSLDRSAVKSGLNFGDIRGFKMIDPPVSLQQKFAAIVRRFERLRAQQREAERQAEHLFQTLLHRAFREGM